MESAFQGFDEKNEVSEGPNNAMAGNNSGAFLDRLLLGLGENQSENVQPTPILESSGMDMEVISTTVPDAQSDDDSFPSGCCTPNIDNMNEESYEEESVSGSSRDSSLTRRGGVPYRPIAVALTALLPSSKPVLAKEESPKIKHRFCFEKVAAADVKDGCQNRTEKEKVRNYNKAPVAAGQKYLKDLDPIVNSRHYQLLTNVKFSKSRVEKCVRESRESVPVSDAVMQVHRRFRRYSDPSAYSELGYEDHLIKHAVMDEGMRRAQEKFPQMINWLMWTGKYREQWPLEDDARILFPDTDSVILVRVMEMVGRRATVVPAAIFEDLSSKAKSFVEQNQPLPLLDDFNEHAMVLFMQESDVIDEYEYRRGWVFEVNAYTGLLSVLLMDERRIVYVPRNYLCKCPEDIIMHAPPLCVSAEFDREVSERELQLLYIGCKTQCRVLAEKEGAASLKLQLVNIDTQGRSLDGFFCSIECDGACNHRQG